MGTEADEVGKSIASSVGVIFVLVGFTEWSAFRLRAKAKVLKVRLATVAKMQPSVRLGRPSQTGEYIKSKARHQHCERWSHRLNQISKTILLPVIVFWLYLVIGAFLFQHLERDVEAQAHDEV